MIKDKRPDLLPDEKKHIWRRDHYICQYCGLDGRSFGMWRYLTVDHINPGGGNEEANLTTCCEACNKLKGNQKFDSIEKAKGYIIQELNNNQKKEYHEQMIAYWTAQERPSRL